MKSYFCSFLLFSILVSTGALCQNFSIHGEEGYKKPEYLALERRLRDPADVRSHFSSALQRAGFNVVNPAWVQQQIKDEQSRINVAVFLSSQDSELAEESLKEQLREQGVSNGWKSALESLVQSGHVIERQELIQGDRIAKKVSFFSWSRGKPIPKETWSQANTVHILSFNYEFRDSRICGKTLSELHGTIRDISGDLNEQIIDFDFNQPSGASECPVSIVNEIVRRLTKDIREAVVDRRTAVKSDASFSIAGDLEEIAQVQTILTVAKPGKDCLGLEGSHFEDEIALGLLEAYDVVDRSVTDHIIEEHKLNMDGLYRDSDFIEAGQFAGAEALITVQPTCLSNKNVLKVKMISINSSLLLWSAILKNSERSITAEEVLETIQN